MVFASLNFIFTLLPIFLAVDFSTRYFFKDISTRNILLILISILFYVWGEGDNVLLLIALSIINWYAGIVIHNQKNNITAIFFIVLNLSILIGFKYTYWFISFIAPDIISQPVLPLGISFFTFHAISYLIDIWRGNIQPAKNVLSFLTYFCMFPHLVAGPIVRYAQVQSDLNTRGPNRDLFSYGMYRFLMGLNKKVLIANSVSLLADSAFSLSAQGHLHFFDAWLGIIAYTIQIYFDFSGYSDMAIGLAAMAGFHFEENFNRPYSSTSIRDFWRRWHISLSSWLRDYLYIPLGGGRGSIWSTYRNQIIVFVLCGLWHGANVTFVVWGLWHGMFLVLERMRLCIWLDRLPTFLTRSYALLVVMIGWVFFRAETLSASGEYLKVMFSPSLAPVLLGHYLMAMMALTCGILLCLMPDRWVTTPCSRNPATFSTKLYILHAALAVISVAMLITSSRNPFIYFNF